MPKGRTLLGLLVLVCSAAIIAGCGSSSSSNSGGSSGASSASSGSGGSGKKLTVGYVAYTLTAPPQQDMKKGFEQEAQKYGYTVKTVDAQGDAAKANSLMQTFVTQRVDAIVTDSFSADTLRAGITAAKQAGIPVYLGYAPGDSPDLAAAIQANAGTESASLLVKQLGPSGSVLAFTLPPGPNCVSSEKQFDAVMAANPGWKVQKQPVPVPGWAQAASSATNAWLKSHPKGQKLAIWGCWDGPAAGAASALVQAGRTDVKVYGQNTEADSAALLQKNDYAASYYFDSAALARHIMDIVHSNAGVPVGSIKHVFERFKGILVTPSTVNVFLKKYPQVTAG